MTGIMPRAVSDHDSRRRSVCAVCLGRGPDQITDTILKRIRRLPNRRFYKPSDKAMPAGICGTCRNRLWRAEASEPGRILKIDAPDVKPVDISEPCTCRWCQTAQAAGRPTKRMKKKSARPTPQPVQRQLSADVLQKVQSTLDLSTQQTITMASVIRKKMGRSAVEPHIKMQLEDRDRVLDDWFAGVCLPLETTDKLESVPVVVCGDTSGFILRVASMRQADPRPHMVKIGLDRGGDFLKITANIVQRREEDSISKAASSSSAFRDTGVKRLFLLALAPRALETWVNIQRLLQLLHLEDVGALCFTVDMKMANILCGLQVSFREPRVWSRKFDVGFLK